MSDFTPAIGSILRVLASHPHGPCYAKVIRIETLGVLNEKAPRCRHLRGKPACCEYGPCETEFFVFEKDVLGG